MRAWCSPHVLFFQTKKNIYHINSKQMEVKFKKLHREAVLPAYAKSDDAGMDLTVTSFKISDKINQTNQITYKFGIAVEIPKGFVGLIFPRSSIYKKQHLLSNSVGVIDSGYRGEITAVFYFDGLKNIYTKGERAAQLVIIPYPKIEPTWSNELTKTERGDGGYGSTGK